MSHASSSFEPSAEVVLCSAKGKDHNFVGERDELTMVSGDSAHGEDGSRHHQYVPSPASESQPHELPTVDSAASSHLQNTEMNNSALYQNQQLSQVQASTSPLRSALLEDSRASSVEVIDSGRYSSSREGANILHKPMIMQSLPPPPAANHTGYNFAGPSTPQFSSRIPGLAATHMFHSLMPPTPLPQPMPWGPMSGSYGTGTSNNMFYAAQMPPQMPPPSLFPPPPPLQPMYYGSSYGASSMMPSAMGGFGSGGLGMQPLPFSTPHSFHLMQPPPLMQPLRQLTKAELVREHKRAANRKSALVSREKRRMFVDEVMHASRRLKWQKRILDMLPDLIISVNRHGSISYASRSVLERLHLSSRVLGTPVFEVVAPEARGAAAVLLQQSTTQLGEGPHHAEIDLIASTGLIIRCDASATAAVSEDGFVEAVVSLRPQIDLQLPQPSVQSAISPLTESMSHAASSSSSLESAVLPSRASESSDV